MAFVNTSTAEITTVGVTIAPISIGTATIGAATVGVSIVGRKGSVNINATTVSKVLVPRLVKETLQSIISARDAVGNSHVIVL